eukprot:Gregarina_sp_Poly_1__1077@NODE_1263_length_4573_cov_222_049046_g858_i0_p2_GENE_NODE_1263_length_4573_cov_222_049046_g858_i0NODE_1263_length_4573_cov_222_049046_g858_i0_p2_ORF_typecomplete_len378_score68_58_NODE_1263_length_4573_cov_222_049046_g858_i025913724
MPNSVFKIPTREEVPQLTEGHQRRFLQRCGLVAGLPSSQHSVEHYDQARSELLSQLKSLIDYWELHPPKCLIKNDTKVTYNSLVSIDPEDTCPEYTEYLSAVIRDARIVVIIGKESFIKSQVFPQISDVLMNLRPESAEELRHAASNVSQLSHCERIQLETELLETLMKFTMKSKASPLKSESNAFEFRQLWKEVITAGIEIYKGTSSCWGLKTTHNQYLRSTAEGLIIKVFKGSNDIKRTAREDEYKSPFHRCILERDRDGGDTRDRTSSFCEEPDDMDEEKLLLLHGTPAYDPALFLSAKEQEDLKHSSSIQTPSTVVDVEEKFYENASDAEYDEKDDDPDAAALFAAFFEWIKNLICCIGPRHRRYENAIAADN